MKIHRMKINEEGLNRFFGSLEAQIMAIVWSESEEVSIKKVQSLLTEELSFNTVMTVLNRLVEKGHLTKTSLGKGRNKTSSFAPVQSKEQFVNEQTKIVTEELVQEYGQMVVNHFFDAFEQTDPELMRLMEERINQWKRDKDET
ncbi:BlaI/MecI/CopY family transcriptional regulator [Paenibacillus sp. L3-i20]|uniref:BlaI/MecI/CopY family transcriptional regulator n=1 Tax=Paenibacillus sp. L3-i20 TaxID=2905833 RepID=UPI001EDFE807|nr:BlaI/MecI/CopY family transcriptional regulator [Paenibacillus sp. L3-i20]GKU80545.1 transcriptional regulator [Paenibacillus sp. L3-i20]